MKVRYATQLLSRTVSAGMKTMVHDGRLPPEAARTSEFFLKANNCFDLLNSTTPDTFAHKQAISQINCHRKFEEIDEFIDWVKKWTFHNNQVSKSSMPFQKGLLTTLTGMKEVVKQCFEMDFRFVATRRLNQDCLEVRILNRHACRLLVNSGHAFFLRMHLYKSRQVTSFLISEHVFCHSSEGWSQ